MAWQVTDSTGTTHTGDDVTVEVNEQQFTSSAGRKTIKTALLWLSRGDHDLLIAVDDPVTLQWVQE